MNARQILNELTAQAAISAGAMFEASVHLPRRGTRWIAAYRGPDGRPVWRSTRLTDRAKALELAKSWEKEAQANRAGQPSAPPKPTIRVRPGSGERHAGLLTQQEVAAILRISERAVREIERRAFDKLRRHPALRRFRREWVGDDLQENGSTGGRLTPVEEMARANPCCVADGRTGPRVRQSSNVSRSA